MDNFHGTTIVAVLRAGHAAVAGDGQITFGENTIMKHNSVKVRRLYNGTVLAGMAGSAADALTLMERFETKLQTFRGNLERACVELAKEWRTDRVLRKLEAMMIVADGEHLLVVSGNGDVIEPDDGVVAIGSGGSYALAAARALLKHTDLTASEIAREAVGIAAQICVFTNDHITVEEL